MFLPGSFGKTICHARHVLRPVIATHGCRSPAQVGEGKLYIGVRRSSMQEPDRLGKNYSRRGSTDERDGDGFSRQRGATAIIVIQERVSRVFMRYSLQLLRLCMLFVRCWDRP